MAYRTLAGSCVCAGSVEGRSLGEAGDRLSGHGAAQRKTGNAVEGHREGRRTVRWEIEDDKGKSPDNNASDTGGMRAQAWVFRERMLQREKVLKAEARALPVTLCRGVGARTMERTTFMDCIRDTRE